jgi:energy-converting hydrogenase Eha subunit A
MTRPALAPAREWFSATLRGAGWAPLLVFVVYLGAAVVLDLFSAIPRLDFPMHFAGGLATAYLVSHGLQNARRIWGRPSTSSAWDTVIVLALTLLVALLWEGLEFSSDRLFGTQEQLGTADTVRDLLAGMLGALAYVALPKVFPRPEG